VAKWQKGQSGNPGGRPREIGELRALARKRTKDALDTLAAVMADPKAPPAARVAAAVAILDRGHGRPAQTTVLEGGDGGAPRLIVEIRDPTRPGSTSEGREP
jgi:hypothetical protein